MKTKQKKQAQKRINDKVNAMSEQVRIMKAKQRMVNPSTVWLLFLFLGWSYGSMNQGGMQVLFYITFGGFGIWALIRLFTLSGAIKRYNNDIMKLYKLG